MNTELLTQIAPLALFVVGVFSVLAMVAIISLRITREQRHQWKPWQTFNPLIVVTLIDGTQARPMFTGLARRFVNGQWSYRRLTNAEEDELNLDAH